MLRSAWRRRAVSHEDAHLKAPSAGADSCRGRHSIMDRAPQCTMRLSRRADAALAGLTQYVRRTVRFGCCSWETLCP
jgi:hypothetical protein